MNLKNLRLNKFYKVAYERLSKTATNDVVDWANSTLWGTQAGLDGFRATADRAALEEARRGALSLVAATEVLLDRLDK